MTDRLSEIEQHVLVGMKRFGSPLLSREAALWLIGEIKSLRQGISEKDDDIDRLLAENTRAANELVEYAKLAAAGTAEQQAEIERRLEEAAEWHNRAVQYGNEVHRLEIEVEYWRMSPHVGPNELLLTERTESDRLRQAFNDQSQRLQLALAESDHLRALVDEVKSCGHWSDCPAGVSDKYRCRCAYGIILEYDNA